MAAPDGQGEESSSFWCADAARYAVASVVTILIVAVAVKAVMVLHPNKPLYLSVPGGSALIRRSASQRGDMLLRLRITIRAQNPSGDYIMGYTGVMGYIFTGVDVSSSSSSNPKNDSIFYFDVPGRFVVERREEVLKTMYVSLRRGRSVESWTSWWDFYVLTDGDTGGGIVSDLTLRLDGNLTTTKVTPEGRITSCRWASFYCRPLLAGGNLDVDASLNKQDAFCVSGG